MTRGVILGLLPRPVYYKRLAPVFLGAVLLSMPFIGAQALNFAGGKDARSLRSMAFEHYMDKDVDTAFDYYDQAVAAALREYGQGSTYVADLLYEEGTFALQSSRFNKAEESLKEAVKQNPNSVMAHVKLAEVLQVRERPDLAFQQIQAALAKNSRSPEARRALVLWLLGQKNSADAIRESYVLVQGTAASMPRDVETRVAEGAPPAKEESKEEKKPIAILPVLPFLRGAAPKPTPAPAPAPAAKPAPAKPAAKPAAKNKPAAAPAKHERPKSKPREHAKPAKNNGRALIAPVPVVAGAKPPEELRAVAGSLKTSASIKKAKSERSENETSSSDQPSVASMSLTPPPEPVKRHGKGRSTTLVPPPPPTPAYIAPPPMVPPPQQSRPAPKREKPKEAPAAEEKPAAASASGGGDDDYLLKWAGVKNKKKP
ncbi:MAG TPA: hypothetical protein V6C81_00485 [Planktothrix sp.]